MSKPNAWAWAAIFVVLATLGSPSFAGAAKVDVEQLRAGKNFLETKVYSEEEDMKLIGMFKNLRVADVCDGMDAVGLQNVGNMDPEIRPLWRDTKEFTHRIVGVAVTVRWVPSQKGAAGRMPTEEFRKWVSHWYGTFAPEAFGPILRKGSVLVTDNIAGPRVDVGPIGSNNSMGWRARGCVGVVSNGTARDTDEVMNQGLPVYCRQVGRGIRPGRIELESVNRPVVVGGVLVMPGDVIVADGDGVIVVPRAVAADVANYAQAVLDGDKKGRRGLYEKLGLPEDASVR
ncbi:MAG: RraA family protein [Candidatus Sumerlaeia bacterium]|nr:RraA family protein [Candidatus Sumerlaeia bacterium]